uniref:Uncharacterized protein n=1 Tax=Triticum urartu TaxID=4572 RepID=A0A8R7PEF5_TRIUA
SPNFSMKKMYYTHVRGERQTTCMSSGTASRCALQCTRASTKLHGDPSR